MKKFAVGLLVVLLLALATSVASAEKPPGVDGAFRVSDMEFKVGVSGSLYSCTKTFTQYSNGSTGHSTNKCKLELIEGPPVEFFDEFDIGNCNYSISIEGKKGMWTRQCFGEWYP